MKLIISPLFRLLVVFGLSLSLSGCPLRRASKLGEGFLPIDSSAQVEAFLEKARAVTTFRSLVSLEITSTLRKDRVKQIVLFRRPDDLRVEVFAPGLNQLLSIAVVRDGLLQAYDVEEKTLYTGPASPENIAAVIQVPFRPEEFMLWLCGRFSLMPPSRRVGLWRRGGEFALEVDYPDGRWVRLYLDPEGSDLALRKLELFVGQSAVLESSFTYGETALLPKAIAFTLPIEDVSGKMTFSRPELNPLLADDRMFTLPDVTPVRTEELK